LGNPKNWWQGGWSLVLADRGSTDIGLLFRREKNELLLFFNGGIVEGIFDGEHTKGLFGADEKRTKQLDEWKRQYAQPEFSAQKRSNQAMQPTASPCTASVSDD
jgi:hypothetical protein